MAKKAKIVATAAVDTTSSAATVSATAVPPATATTKTTTTKPKKSKVATDETTSQTTTSETPTTSQTTVVTAISQETVVTDGATQKADDRTRAPGEPLLPFVASSASISSSTPALTGGYPQYVLELAKSNRACCKRCECKIDKSDLRVGVIDIGDWGLFTKWYHLPCVVFHHRVNNALSMDGYLALTEEQKQAVDDRIAATRNAIDPDRVALDPNEIVRTEWTQALEPTSDLLMPLLPYQKEGLGWMVHQEKSDARGGILADEMGMGKTIQAISMILSNRPLAKPDTTKSSSSSSSSSSSLSKAMDEWKEQDRIWSLLEKNHAEQDKVNISQLTRGGTLIVLPTVAIRQWQAEIARFTTNGSLTVKVYHGSDRNSSFLRDLSAADIVITSYKILEIDYRKATAGTKVTCRLCGRKFYPEKLRVHRKYFCGETAQKTEAQSKQQKKKSQTVIAIDDDSDDNDEQEEEDDDSVTPVKSKRKAASTTKATTKATTKSSKKVTRKDDLEDSDEDEEVNTKNGKKRQVNLKQSKGTSTTQPAKRQRKVIQIVDSEDEEDEEDEESESDDSIAEQKRRNKEKADNKKKKGTSPAAANNSNNNNKSNVASAGKKSKAAKTTTKGKKKNDSDDEDDDDKAYEDESEEDKSEESDSDDSIAQQKRRNKEKAAANSKKGKPAVNKRGKMANGGKKSSKPLAKGKKSLDGDDGEEEEEYVKEKDDESDSDSVDEEVERDIAEAIKKSAKTTVKSQSLLHQISWFRIVLDEAHMVKDRSSSTARAVFNLVSLNKWCLTGTPLQNRVGELYSLVRFLRIDPHAYYYCSKKGCNCKSLHYRFTKGKCEDCDHTAMNHFCHFNKHVLNPIKRCGYIGDGRKAMLSLKSEILDNVLLRRTKTSRADDIQLPPRIVRVSANKMDEREEDFYQALYTQSQAQFNTYVAAGTVLNNYAHIFDILIRLRQAVDHPYLVIHSDKRSLDANLLLNNDNDNNNNHSNDNNHGFSVGTKSNFKATNKKSSKSSTTTTTIVASNDECSLCHDEVEDGVQALCCGHQFCRLCITDFLQTLNSELLPKLLGEGDKSNNNDDIDDFDGDGKASKKPKRGKDKNTNSSSSSTSATTKTKCPHCSNNLSIDLSSPTDDKITQNDDNSNTEMDDNNNDFMEHNTLSVWDASKRRAKSILTKIDLSSFQSSTKMEALMRELDVMIANDPGAKAIVFSQFVNMLDLLEYRIQCGGIGCVKLVGSLTIEQRDIAIKKLQNDISTKVLLISLKAGGVALNLTTASYIFLMDPWWNPAAEMQAIDRTHRIGQHKPIYATRFVIADSIEERILHLQAKKKLVFDGTIGGDASAIARLTVDDMRFLFQ